MVSQEAELGCQTRGSIHDFPQLLLFSLPTNIRVTFQKLLRNAGDLGDSHSNVGLSQLRDDTIELSNEHVVRFPLLARIVLLSRTGKLLGVYEQALKDVQLSLHQDFSAPSLARLS